jgi:protoporphyrinogen oxidase
VTVLERQQAVGGNAGSFELAGFHVDYGSHRLHPSCDPAIMSDIRSLLGTDLLDRPRHGRIRLLGRWLRFPLKPLNLLFGAPPRFAACALRDALRKLLPGTSATDSVPTFSSVLRDGLGPTICNDFYFPYVQKIWGLDPDDISPTLAVRRVQGNSISRLLKKVLISASPLKPAGRGRFFYPKHGFGQISQSFYKAATEKGALFHLGAEVKSIRTDGRSAAAVEYAVGASTTTVAADHVWSTIPLTSLVRAIQPSAPAEVLDSADQIRFRSMILVYFVIEQPRFTEYDAHYFPAADTVISRLSEPRNYSAIVEPAQSTVVCAELPCAVDEPYWNMSDEQLADIVRDDLARNEIPVTATVSEVVTRRLPHAYPTYDLGYDQHFERLDRWISGIDGLLTFGRQGLFAHDNTHHALLMAYRAAECLSDSGRFDHVQWESARRDFASHVVED